MATDIENIGFYWLGHELRTPAGRKIKGKIWWGVCKKTKKVAHSVICSDTLHAMAPMVIQKTDIKQDICFDGKSCLNVDCPYAECITLIEAIHKTNFKDINTDENLINFFERHFKVFEEYIDSLSSEETQKHLIDGFESPTICESAFETRMKK